MILECFTDIYPLYSRFFLCYVLLYFVFFYKAPPLPESTSTVEPTRVTTFIEPHVKVVPAVLQVNLKYILMYICL